MRKFFAILFLLAIFIGISRIHPRVGDEIDLLILQLNGEGQYFHGDGKEVGFFDSLKYRNFSYRCRMDAANLLGKKGKASAKAVDALIDQLMNGPNDWNTGDGIIPFRTTIARALGRINNPRAIDPLIAKLKVSETYSLTSGANPSPYSMKTGMGRVGIIQALGMFGKQAEKALSLLEELQVTDKELAPAIGATIERIRKDERVGEGDFFN